MRYYLLNAMTALQCECYRVAVDQLKLALACANREQDNQAKAFIMRALNYARRVPVS